MAKKIDPVDQFFLLLFKSPWFYTGVAVISLAIWIWASMPTWEERNQQRVLDTLGTITTLAEQKPVEAWTLWESLQKELSGKKIASGSLQGKIAQAQEKMADLKPQIQEELDRLEDKRQLAAASARDAAAKQQQLQAEAEAKEALRKKYRNINQQAKDAVASLKRLEAFTEVGVTKIKYQEALGEAWGNIKVFIESAEAKEDYPELCALLATAIESYKDAARAWDSKTLLQEYWALASKEVAQIDRLVNQ